MTQVQPSLDLSKRAFLQCAAGLALAAASPTVAFATDDAGIYDPSVPKDWSFIRIALKGITPDTPVKIGDKVLALKERGVSEYIARAPGNYTVEIGGRSSTLTLGQAQYMTVLASDDGVPPVVVLDEFTNDPAKCALALYNLTGETLSLTALEKRAPVLSAVAPMTGISREVNAVSIDLNVEIGNNIIKTFAKTVLKRRSVTSIFAFTPNPDDIVLTLAGAKA